MSSVIADTSAPQEATQSWPLHYDRALTLQAAKDAARSVRRRTHNTIVSVVQSVPWRDPLALFTAARACEPTTSFYWEQPSERRALIGVGAAATLSTTSNDAIRDIEERWRSLLADAHVVRSDNLSDEKLSGPVCFGGFAFDPQVAGSALWTGFPAGLLILPELLVSIEDDRASLTVNGLLTDSQDSERLVEHWAMRVMRLGAEIERTALPTTFASERVSLQERPDGGVWMRSVAEARQHIRREAYSKVVLARSVRAQAERPFDVTATLSRLRASYPTAHVFAVARGEKTFLGATPERLARVVRDGEDAATTRIETMALAGTSWRGATEAEDAALGAELLANEKNRHEHAIVAATVRDDLAALAVTLHIPERPCLLKLQNVQHLITPITGTLRPQVTILDVIAALHPTPAVGGYPREKALAAIRALERLDRGWYAGPLGWVAASGEGEFAVALRSAVVAGDEATLFAGCGIVADSDPQTELQESQLKLQVMLHGLGVNTSAEDSE